MPPKTWKKPSSNRAKSIVYCSVRDTSLRDFYIMTLYCKYQIITNSELTWVLSPISAALYKLRLGVKNHQFWDDIVYENSNVNRGYNRIFPVIHQLCCQYLFEKYLGFLYKFHVASISGHFTHLIFKSCQTIASTVNQFQDFFKFHILARFCYLA